MSNPIRCIYTVSSGERIEEAFMLAYQISRKLTFDQVDFYIFISDEASIDAKVYLPDFVVFSKNFALKIVPPSVFSEQFFLGEHYKRTLIERVVAFKANALSYLFALNLYSSATYFDSDIYILSLSTNLWRGQNKVICIAPHTRNVLNKDFHIYLRDGAFNSGYFIIDFTNTEAIEFINFFVNFCRSFSYHDRNLGLFVDQKAFDLVSMFFSVNVIVNSKTNWAYWNLNEPPKVVNDADEFFHFSGFNVNQIDNLSIHQKQKLDYPSEILEALCDYSFLLKAMKVGEPGKRFYTLIDVVDDRTVNYDFMRFSSFCRDYFVDNRVKTEFDMFLIPLKLVIRHLKLKHVFRILSDRRFY